MLATLSPPLAARALAPPEAGPFPSGRLIETLGAGVVP